MNKSAPVLAWPLSCLALILVGIALNIPVQQLPWAFPGGWAAAPSFIFQLSALISLLAIALLIAGLVQQKQFNGTLFEAITLHLLIFAAVWVILPTAASKAWIWILGGTLIAGTAFLLWQSKGTWPAACSRYFVSRKDALADGLIIGLPVITGLYIAGGSLSLPGGGQPLSSLLLYPLYALFQLSIFLVIPATRMRKMGYSSRVISIACAVVFCLVHWPNPLLMAATGITMLIWASQFLRGRSILVLALIMGLGAAGVSLLLPRQWTMELRIGPDYIEKRAEREQSFVPGS